MNSTLSSTLFSWWYKTIFTLKYTFEDLCPKIQVKKDLFLRHLANKLFFADDAGTKYYIIWFSFPRSCTSFSKQETIWHIASLLKTLIFWTLILYLWSCMNFFLSRFHCKVWAHFPTYLYLNLRQSWILSYYQIVWYFYSIRFPVVFFSFL